MNNFKFPFLCSIFVLSSCVSNAINIKPNAEEYSKFGDTPAYIKKSSDKDIDTFESELDECIKTCIYRVQHGPLPLLSAAGQGDPAEAAGEHDAQGDHHGDTEAHLLGPRQGHEDRAAGHQDIPCRQG